MTDHFYVPLHNCVSTTALTNQHLYKQPQHILPILFGYQIFKMHVYSKWFHLILKFFINITETNTYNLFLLLTLLNSFFNTF